MSRTVSLLVLGGVLLSLLSSALAAAGGTASGSVKSVNGTLAELRELIEMLAGLNASATSKELLGVAKVYDNVAACASGLVAERARVLAGDARLAAEGGVVDWWRDARLFLRALYSNPYSVSRCPSSLLYRAIVYAYATVAPFTLLPPKPQDLAGIGGVARLVLLYLGAPQAVADSAARLAARDPYAAAALAALAGRADRDFWLHVLADVSTVRGLCTVFSLADPELVPSDIARAALSIAAGTQDPAAALGRAVEFALGGDEVCSRALVRLLEAAYRGYLGGLEEALGYGAAVRATAGSMAFTYRLSDEGLAGLTVYLYSKRLIYPLIPSVDENVTACRAFRILAANLAANTSMWSLDTWGAVGALASLCFAATGDAHAVRRLLILQPFTPLLPQAVLLGSSKAPREATLTVGSLAWRTTQLPLLRVEWGELEALASVLGLEPSGIADAAREALRAAAGNATAAGEVRAMLSAGNATWRLVRLGALARLAAASFYNGSWILSWGAVRATASLLAPLAGVKANPLELAVKTAMGIAPPNTTGLLLWALGLTGTLEPPLEQQEAPPATGHRLARVEPQTVAVLAEALRQALQGSNSTIAARLGELAGEIEATLSLGRLGRAANLSSMLRDTVLAEVDEVARLAAERGAGEAGLPLLLAKLSSIVGWDHGMLLLDPSTEREVFSAIEAAVERAYMHAARPRVRPAVEAGGGASRAGGGGLLGELREALREGDTSRAAAVLARIYATGNPKLIAEAARLLRSEAPPELASIVERMASFLRREHGAAPRAALPSPPAPRVPAGVKLALGLTVASIAVASLAAAASRLPRLLARRKRAAARLERLGERPGSPRLMVIVLFEQLMDSLEGRFGPRRPWETVREYAARLPEGVRRAFMEAARLWEEARFSRHRIGLEHVRRLSTILDRLRGERGD